MSNQPAAIIKYVVNRLRFSLDNRRVVVMPSRLMSTGEAAAGAYYQNGRQRNDSSLQHDLCPSFGWRCFLDSKLHIVQRPKPRVTEF